MKEQKVYATVHYASGAKTDIVSEEVAKNLRHWLRAGRNENDDAWFPLGMYKTAKEFINLNNVAFVKFHD